MNAEIFHLNHTFILLKIYLIDGFFVVFNKFVSLSFKGKLCGFAILSFQLVL